MGGEQASKPNGQAGDKVTKPSELIIERFNTPTYGTPAPAPKMEGILKIREIETEKDADAAKKEIASNINDILESLIIVTRASELKQGNTDENENAAEFNSNLDNLESTCEKAVQIIRGVRKYERKKEIASEIDKKTGEYTNLKIGYSELDEKEKAAQKEYYENNLAILKRAIDYLENESEMNNGIMSSKRVEEIKTSSMSTLERMVIDSNLPKEALNKIIERISKIMDSMDKVPTMEKLDSIEVYFEDIQRNCAPMPRRTEQKIEKKKEDIKDISNLIVTTQEAAAELMLTHGKKDSTNTAPMIKEPAMQSGAVMPMIKNNAASRTEAKIQTKKTAAANILSLIVKRTARVIGYGGFVAGSLSLAAGSLAMMIENCGLADKIMMKGEYAKLAVAANYFLEYVNVLGEPAKLLIGGAIVAVSSIVVGLVLNKMATKIGD